MDVLKPKYVRAKDAALFFSISQSTLQRWRQQDGFPKPLERGSTVLYDPIAIEAWLANEELIQ